MKRVISLLIFLSTPAAAKDFGVHGHIFEIQEPDLLKEMESKLKRLEGTGKLTEINESLVKRAENSLKSPKAVAGITKTLEAREFFYDPSIIVPYDLKDHEGHIFHKAGTRLNPLEFRSLSAPLVFIDGNDKAQVAWTQNTYIKTNQHPKIILTAGSPFELMEKWHQPTYFDQGGTLTRKLGIHHVPAVVAQVGLKLKISEIVVEEQTIEGDKP